MIHSLRVRLTLAVMAASSCLVCGLAWVLYSAVDDSLRHRFDEELMRDGQLLGDSIEYERGDGLEFELGPAVASFGRRTDARTWWSLTDAAGRTVAGDAGPVLRAPSKATTPVFWSARVEQTPVRVAAWQFHARPEDHSGTGSTATPRLGVAIARETAPLEAMLADLRRTFWLFGVLSALVLGAVVAWQIDRGVRPIRQAGLRLEGVDLDNLRARLDATTLPSELSPFVERLNGLLRRLDAGVAREREFTGHVAHELRTPLSVLRTTIEVTARRAGTDAALQTRFADLLTTVEDMTALVDNLLILSRVDRNAFADARERVDLHAEVAQAWTSARTLAERRNVRFVNRVRPGHELETDVVRLRIVLRNLLGNAASYTEAGGQIEARGLPGGFEIWDSGPQLPAEPLERVFDRFWRADVARSDATAHAGIGLSLVRELCESLGWEVSVHNVASGGLGFYVRTNHRPVANSGLRTDVAVEGPRRAGFRMALADAGTLARRRVLVWTAFGMAAVALAVGLVWMSTTTRLLADRGGPGSAVYVGGEPVPEIASVSSLPGTRSSTPHPSEAGSVRSQASGGDGPPVSGESSPAVRLGSAAAGPGSRARDAAGATPPPGRAQRDRPAAQTAFGHSAPTRTPAAIGSNQSTPRASEFAREPLASRSTGVGFVPSAGTRHRGPLAETGQPDNSEAEHAGDSGTCNEDEAGEGTKLDASVCALDGSFSATVDNPWFPLPPGRWLVFEGSDEGELVQIYSHVLVDTVVVAGVETRVVETTEVVDKEKEETVREYFAQATDGTVCRFGEDVEAYEDDGVVNHYGRWRADDPGCAAGIQMPGVPTPNTYHAVESAPQVAMDHANIIALGEAVSVPYGDFSDTITVSEWSPLESCESSVKIYVADIGLVFDDDVMLIAIKDGETSSD